jgi:DNA-binding IclR family transcriptional regulator
MSTESRRLGRAKRTDEAYVIDAGIRLLKVMEALEGTNFEPVTIQRVQQRTGYTYDFCRRALFTLKRAGYAAQTERGWQVGPRLLRFSERFNNLCLAAMHAEDSAISESKRGG